MNTQEYWEKQVLFACRQNQPAGYGFYFPAIDDHEDEDEDMLNSKMRRISRLASIVEEERNLCDEGVEQQSAHCDSDSSKKDETAAVDHDIRIASLINTAELLKKQKSSNWLREFKEWMDDNTEKTEGDNLSVDLTNGNGKYIRQKKKQKAHKEASDSMSDLVQVSEGGSSSNLLESDSSFTDAFSGSNGVIKQSSNELNFDQDHLRMNLNSFQRPPPLELVATSQTDPFSELGNGGSTSMLPNGTSSNTMIKLIESSPPHIYPSPQSPPQYKEDILHRRLFLEEEFLQISGHLHSVGSLGSGSSCSDGSSSDFGSCNSEDDCEEIQTKMKLSLNGQMVLFPSVNGDDDEAKNDLEHFSGENTLSDHSEEGDPSCSDHREFDIEEFHDSNQRNGHLGHYLGHLIGQKGKTFKWRVFSFKNHNGTKLEIPKMNGDQVAEHVLVEGNGQLTCNPSKSTHKEGSKSHSSNILHKNNSSVGTNIIPHNTGDHKTLEDFFNMEIANKDGSETCEQVACCAYMVQDSSGVVQREVALLRSSQNKLYVLLLDMVFNGQETMPSILGSYSLESLEKVSIGLGLQALRIHMSDDTTHLFLTRNSKEAQDVLWLLSVTNFPKLNHKIHFQSWENIQIKLFEKCIIRRTANMGIFLYSMLMFWRNDAEEDSLCIRSIFVVEGSILVCIEDLDQFGGIPYDSNPPYFSLDASCSISNIREVVMDQQNSKCLTLILDNRGQGEFHYSIQNPQNKQSDEISTIHTWKLKWFSEEASLKFISVLKALYSAAAASSLPVKCIS